MKLKTKLGKEEFKENYEAIKEKGLIVGNNAAKLREEYLKKKEETIDDEEELLDSDIDYYIESGHRLTRDYFFEADSSESAIMFPS